MSAFTSQTPNYSLFALPAYFILTLLPHAYSTTLLHPPTQPTNDSTGTTNKKTDSPSPSKPPPRTLYNMSNPRSSSNTNTYSSLLPSHIYARYERARGAHNNMLENSGFFASAILAGIVARVDAGHMNTVVGMYLLSRVAYLVCYIGVEKGKWSFLRTACWALGMVCIADLWVVSGARVARGQY